MPVDICGYEICESLPNKLSQEGVAFQILQCWDEVNKKIKIPAFAKTFP